MSSHANPETLLAYWLGELLPAEEAPLEEHFLGCAQCTRRLEELAALGGGIRTAVREGVVAAFVPARFAEAMAREGLRVREYRVAAGASVNCALPAGDDAVLGRMQVPLAGVQRLDAVRRIDVAGARGAEVRLEDVPFDPGAGEVLYMPSPVALRRIPAHVAHVRLVAVEAGGERTLGEYTFVHSG